MPARTFYRLAVLGLLGLALLMSAVVPFKWFVYEIGFGPGAVASKSVVAGLVVLALGSGLGLLAATTHWARRAWRQRRGDGDVRRVGILDVLTVSAMAVVWYFASFAVFYSLDGTFPFQGGTTLYCHERPIVSMYLPLFELAKSKGWSGGCPYRFPCSGWEDEKPIHDFFKCVENCPENGDK